MCFSVFSFPTFADEVVGAKTRAELQELVSGFTASWRGGGLWDNGTHSAERFELAYEVAESTLSNGEATPEEITVAWVLLDAAFEGLVKKTMAELNALIVEVRGTYNRNNVFNSNNEDDLMFSEGSFAAFKRAYDDADDLSDPDDTNEITDAYLRLSGAFDGLDRLQVVTRNDMRNMERTVDRLADDRNKFTDERRGRTSTTADGYDETVTQFRSRVLPDGTQGWPDACCCKTGGNPIFWGMFWDDAIRVAMGADYATQESHSDFSAYNVTAPAFRTQKTAFDNLNVASTTNPTIVNAFNNVKTTTELIGGFVGDGTARGNQRTIDNLMRTSNDLIVRNENALNASDSSLAMATRAAGGGALTALYGIFTTGAVENTNIPAITAAKTVTINDDGKITSDAPGTGVNALTIPARPTTSVNLINRVAIDARGTQPAYVIGFGRLNALHGGWEEKAQPALGEAWRFAQTKNAIDLPAGFALPANASADDRTTMAARLLTYAIADAGFSDPQETRARLNALIDSSDAIDDLTTSFFGQNGTNHYTDVRSARAAARGELQLNPTSDRAARNDLIQDRNFAPVYGDLNDAINDFNNAFTRDWPVAMDEGQNSVFDVIMASMASDSENIVALRIALGLALLDEQGCDCEDMPKNFDIIDNGSINASARLFNGRSWECEWASYDAYLALRNALGIGVDGYAKGDVNGDGVINTADALEILRYIADLDNVITNNPLALVAASITADAPTTACAIAILRHVAEIELIS
jgi:hypothetical protein